MKTRFLAIALLAPLAASPGYAQTSGWSLDTGSGTATLSRGAADTAGAFRMDCADGQTVFSTWTRNPPRNVGTDEFDTSIRFFLGRTERVYAGKGRPSGSGTTWLSAPITDAATLLDAARRNGRLVVVTHAGRRTSPAPAPSDIDSFGKACAATAQAKTPG